MQFYIKASILLSAGFVGCGTESGDSIKAEDAFPGPVSRDEVSIDAVELIGPVSEHADLIPLAPTGPVMDADELQADRDALGKSLCEALGYESEGAELLLAVRGTVILIADLDPNTTTADIEEGQDQWDEYIDDMPLTFAVGDMSDVTTGGADWI